MQLEERIEKLTDSLRREYERYKASVTQSAVSQAHAEALDNVLAELRPDMTKKEIRALAATLADRVEAQKDTEEEYGQALGIAYKRLRLQVENLLRALPRDRSLR